MATKKPTAKQRERQMDDFLEATFKAISNYRPIPLLDIAKVFNAGRAAYRAFDVATDERQAAARAAMVTMFDTLVLPATVGRL